MIDRPSAELPASRRQAREQSVAARRRPLPRRAALVVLLAVATFAILGSVWAVAVGAPNLNASVVTGSPSASEAPPYTDALPVPRFTAAQAASTGEICADPGVVSALVAGDDDATIAAIGGGAAFRVAVASGAASCIDLGDPARTWLVVNKTRPYRQIDFAPSSLVVPDGIRNFPGGGLRPAVAAVLQKLIAGAAAAGVGDIAIDSAYRSYPTQKATYAQNVAASGQAGGDAVSARPGYSEHQSGLAVDLMACRGGCAAIEQFGSSAQGRWVADHAWEYGFIVRYEDGHTAVTGYSPEPWHLRYIGTDLARAYHDGGWHTLEEFFGLPAAPGYDG